MKVNALRELVKRIDGKKKIPLTFMRQSETAEPQQGYKPQAWGTEQSTLDVQIYLMCFCLCFPRTTP